MLRRTLSGALRFLLEQLGLELDETAQRIGEADAAIERAVRENEACQRLVKIPGIGPATATAVVAAIGNGAAFEKGREFAAWLGVVPRQRSTGGKPAMLGISKRGNAYLRRLFVQGARAVLAQKTSQSAGLKAWLDPIETVIAKAFTPARSRNSSQQFSTMRITGGASHRRIQLSAFQHTAAERL